jgi:hypothetical protein
LDAKAFSFHLVHAGPDLRIQSHPLPLTQEESLQLDTVLNVLAAVFLLIPFCYLSGEVASQALRNAKQLQ